MELLNLHNGQQLYSSSLAVGGLLPIANATENGFMSARNAARMGRIFSKGYYKLTENRYWYYHYGALIYGASPASSNGVMISISWRGTGISATKISGSNGNVRLYIGDNPNTGNHELWLGITGEDGRASEFIIAMDSYIDWGVKAEETLPSYLSEVTIS